MKSKADSGSIDEYIAAFPKETRQKLRELRATIKTDAPDAEEKISYKMPAFIQNGFLVSFAVWKNHIGMYPIPAGTRSFQREIAPYKSAKSSLNFPIDKPLPLKLISQVVKFRVAENLKSAEKKSSYRNSP